MIDYSVSNGVARVTLNRPEKRNALSPELIRELCDSFNRAAADEAARVILLRGAGKDFCAGVDLSGLTEDHLADARLIADLFLALRRNPRPIIAAVQGRALGGGCGLAAASDLVLAAESARFGYPEVNLGFVPAIVAALLGRSVGEKQAFELLSTGDAIAAAEAHRIGLVNRVYPDDSLEAGAEEYARALAAKSASALALTKNLLHHIDGMSLEQAMQSGVLVNALARGTADAQRGIQQFVRKK